MCQIVQILLEFQVRLIQIRAVILFDWKSLLFNLRSSNELNFFMPFILIIWTITCIEWTTKLLLLEFRKIITISWFTTTVINMPERYFMRKVILLLRFWDGIFIEICCSDNFILHQMHCICSYKVLDWIVLWFSLLFHDITWLVILLLV